MWAIPYNLQMTRKSSLSTQESEIAARLRQLRTGRSLSREDVALFTALKPGIITRVELERMPLKYDAALLWMKVFSGDSILPDFRPLNPLWLAYGMEPVHLSWPLYLPTLAELRLSVGTLFSDFVTQNRSVLIGLAHYPPEPVLPESWLSPYLKYWVRLTSEMRQLNEGSDLVGLTLKFSAERLSELSRHAVEILLTLSDIEDRAPGLLTQVSENCKSESVQSEMDKLLAKIRNLTRKKGMKSRLASFLKVPPSRISEWLAGKYEPSGEVTLQLLNWVHKQKR